MKCFCGKKAVKTVFASTKRHLCMDHFEQYERRGMKYDVKFEKFGVDDID